MDTTEDAKPRTRRRHEQDLKQRVLAECAAPGASVAHVAMSYGLNANLVHKWRRHNRGGADPAATFVPIAVSEAPVVSEPVPFIDLELQRGALSVRVRWPMTGAGSGSCAAWLREVLR